MAVFAVRVAVGFAVLVAAGCASGESAPDAVMPAVVGEQLDVALSDIERAGFDDDVEVVGGGTFGVVVESNWQVCEQTPAAGEALTAPRLTVDRSCDEVASETTMAPATTGADDAGTTTTAEPPETTPPTMFTTTTQATETTAPAADPDEVLALLATMPVAEPDPNRTPYERDTYDRDGWGDLDGDCISTRHEILTASSLDPVVMDPSGCFVESGRWVDPYTGTGYTSASDVTIDHVVALAEAHRAGAWRWDLDSRYRLANDEHPGHLVVIGGDVNQSKADQRPDQWLPPEPASHCQYAADWITTKSRYELTITASEKAALEAILTSCSGPIRPIVDGPPPVVATTVPTTTTTTTIAPSAGPGEVTLFSCDARAEVVVIGNTGGEPISLSGYRLHDNDVNHEVSLGQFGSLEPGQRLRLLSGEDATSTDGAVVWIGRNVWNNDGDTAYLIAPDGTLQEVGC